MSDDFYTTVLLDGHDLNQVDASGVRWRFQKISGWHSGASVRLNQQARENDHGEFAIRGQRGSRLIGITGWLHAHDRSLMERARNTLVGILADGNFGVLRFEDRTEGMRWADVQLYAIEADWDGSPNLRYFLQLLAPRPYKYGDVDQASTGFAEAPEGAGLQFGSTGLQFGSTGLQFGALGSLGTVTLENPGTAPAQPRFTVAGPTTGFTITDTTTGARRTYFGSIGAGSTVVYDTSTGTTVMNGVADRSAQMSGLDDMSIPPGESRTYLFEPLTSPAAATLTAAVTATYW